MAVLGGVNNLSIRTKIIGAFLAVLAIVVALGAMSLQRAAETNAQMRDMLDNYVASLAYLEEMKGDIAMSRVYLNRSVMLAQKNLPHVEEDQKLVELIDRYRKNDAGYAATVTPGDEEKLYDQIKTLGHDLLSNRYLRSARCWPPARPTMPCNIF